MKTRNEIINDLEDRLFILKFTRFEGIEAEQALGSIAGLKYCIKRHKENWTIEQFKEDLEKQKADGLYGDYIDGWEGVLKRNIKDMERGGIGSK